MPKHEAAGAANYGAAEEIRNRLIAVEDDGDALRVIDADSYQSLDSSYFRVVDAEGQMFYVRISPAEGAEDGE